MQDSLIPLSHQNINILLLLPPPPPPRTSSRRVTPSTTQNPLPNGDIYTGALSKNIPHGTGKYLWSDGCMYEGEWNKGKASGKGKFSWPSGATYEGQFKSGRMEGFGSFIGVDGDMYRGNWLADRKNGFGEKRYGNGDVYEGWWRCNLQDGEGRYVWKNGNEYVGEWKNGAIWGKGVLVWENGNRYEGYWENGVPKGNGVFTFGNEEKNCEVMLEKKRCSMDGGLKVGGVGFPRICIWELDGEAGDITCEIVDNVDSSVFYKDKDGSESENSGESVLNKSPCWSIDGDQVKKPGQTVSKGHKNYDLMLSLQLGIRYTVGKYVSAVRELRPVDFDPKEKFWIRLPQEGFKFALQQHQSVDFRWKDYCPMVFRHLRELFAIDPADYMFAICGSDSLREMSSPGKSGSIFYLTQDDRFIIKTVKKSEVKGVRGSIERNNRLKTYPTKILKRHISSQRLKVLGMVFDHLAHCCLSAPPHSSTIKVLIRMLPSYYQHVCQYKNSLVTAFLGAHCIKPVGGQKIRFIVMGNVFCSEYRIHKRFDLKGSSHGRITDKPREEIDETTTLKDLDLDFVFRLEQSWFQELKWQLDRDCEFLEAEGIMDYSLLIGLHFRDDYSVDEMEGKGDMHDDEIHISRGPLIRLGMNMPARAVRVCSGRSSNSTSPSSESSSSSNEISDVILYFGIIDILQDYDISKRIEHAYKSLQVDSTSISAVDPKLYSKRFRDFIHKIFVEDK